MIILTILLIVSFYFNVAMFITISELYKLIDFKEEKGIKIVWEKNKYKQCFIRAMKLIKKD